MAAGNPQVNKSRSRPSPIPQQAMPGTPVLLTHPHGNHQDDGVARGQCAGAWRLGLTPGLFPGSYLAHPHLRTFSRRLDPGHKQALIIQIQQLGKPTDPPAIQRSQLALILQPGVLEAPFEGPAARLSDGRFSCSAQDARRRPGAQPPCARPARQSSHKMLPGPT